MAVASSPPKRSASRSRSWLTFSSLVSTTTSAISLIASRRWRSSNIASRTPSCPSGCRRRVPSKRRTSTSSEASRNRTFTASPEALSCPIAAWRSPNWPASRPTTKATRWASGPVPETRSTTLVMSAVGMLSMTYHPRSSRVAPACERPAPESPVTTTNCATTSLWLSRGTEQFLRPQDEQAREGGCLPVLLRPVQETARRGRLDHGREVEPCGHQSVDVYR